jgi:hypothetical protein
MGRCIGLDILNFYLCDMLYIIIDAECVLFFHSKMQPFCNRSEDDFWIDVDHLWNLKQKP